MTQEQKAKAYDEALERAKSVIEQNPLMEYLKKGIEYIFPELKESDDESIRKALVNYFSEQDGILTAICCSVGIKDILDWLEKQGEHANFRSKIQIGDKVTRNKDGMLVNLSQLNRVAKVEEKQGEQKPTDEEIKELLRTEYEKGRADAIAEMQKSWSEEDTNMLGSILSTLDICSYNPDISADVREIHKKEEAWLSELYSRIVPQQKQEWSEEDEEHIKSLLERLEGMCKKDATFIRTKFAVSEDEDWLKSLRPQSQWKPSDTEINILQGVIDGSFKPENVKVTLTNILEHLKKLKG